jgi:hypothetical protein
MPPVMSLAYDITKAAHRSRSEHDAAKLAPRDNRFDDVDLILHGDVAARCKALGGNAKILGLLFRRFGDLDLKHVVDERLGQDGNLFPGGGPHGKRRAECQRGGRSKHGHRNLPAGKTGTHRSLISLKQAFPRAGQDLI